jgi:hypothetical protein
MKLKFGIIILIILILGIFIYAIFPKETITMVEIPPQTLPGIKIP